MLKNRYPLINNACLRLYIYIYDLISRVLVYKNMKKHTPINSIVLRNPAALGDVLYTLRLIEAIKKVNPHLYIGLVVGSWALPLVSCCKNVDAVHIEDHWLLNRRSDNIVKKFFHWLKTRYKAIREIRQQKYDLAIDLYYYFPSVGALFFLSGISNVIGYDSHEGSAFYTKIVKWTNCDVHNVIYQAELLRAANITVSDLTTSVIEMKYQETDEELLNRYKLTAHGYIVICVGTGAKNREWSLSSWRLLLKYIDDNFKKEIIKNIVFVGAGRRENQHIHMLIENGSQRNITLCDKLDIPQLVQVIRQSRLFIGLESFAGHVAAMYKIPQVSIMHGATNRWQWEPFANPNCRVVRKEIKCSPCYFPSKCKYENACMDVNVKDVCKAVREILENENL